MLGKEAIKREIAAAVKAVKKENPLVGSITNTVTINFVANAQLAVGGSAAMVYLPDEGEFLAAAGGATYINVGTLLPIYEETLPRTAQVLYELAKPWVLDPVAVGIGELRTSLLSGFKQYKPTVIRGNASEIIALAGLWGVAGGSAKSQVRGVDSTDSVPAALEAAVALTGVTGGAVAVSGEVDLVTDGKQIAYAYGGSPLMERITGSGCALGGVMAVYLSAASSPFIGAVAGTAAFNLAGERAQAAARGPADFQVRFLDALYAATAEEIAGQRFELGEGRV